MSTGRYANDGRVEIRPNGSARVGDRLVAYAPPFNWAVFAGADLDMVDCGYTSRDAAIESLIGPPQ